MKYFLTYNNFLLEKVSMPINIGEKIINSFKQKINEFYKNNQEKLIYDYTFDFKPKYDINKVYIYKYIDEDDEDEEFYVCYITSTVKNYIKSYTQISIGDILVAIKYTIKNPDVLSIIIDMYNQTSDLDKPLIYEWKTLNKTTTSFNIQTVIDNNYWSAGDMINSGDSNCIININPNKINKIKSDIINIYSHEVNHFFQVLNGFKEIIFKKELFIKNMNDIPHDLSYKESESDLIFLSEMIKRQKYDINWLELRDFYYSSFNKKNFFNKIASLNINTDQLNKFKTFLQQNKNKKIPFLLNLFSINQEIQKDISKTNIKVLKNIIVKDGLIIDIIENNIKNITPNNQFINSIFKTILIRSYLGDIYIICFYNKIIYYSKSYDNITDVIDNSETNILFTKIIRLFNLSINDILKEFQSYNYQKFLKDLINYIQPEINKIKNINSNNINDVYYDIYYECYDKLNFLLNNDFLINDDKFLNSFSLIFKKYPFLFLQFNTDLNNLNILYNYNNNELYKITYIDKIIINLLKKQLI